jgi:hypothetical protein
VPLATLHLIRSDRTNVTSYLRVGILTALTQPDPAALRKAIQETRKLTNKPFGVNITLLPSINPPDYAGYAKAAVEEGVRIFETAGNNRMHLSIPATVPVPRADVGVCAFSEALDHIL